MDSIPFRLKFTLITAVTAGLLSGAEPPRLSACSEAFPPSFLAHHQGEAAFSPDLNLRFLLGKLAQHYFPDCIMLKSPDSGPQQTDPRPGPEENGTEFRLFQSGWEALRRDPENRFPEDWKHLLSLPESERRLCTARTLYLLGNLHAKENPAGAYEWYQKLRKAVNGGIPDPENLAGRSFRSNYFYASDPVERLRYLVLAAGCGNDRSKELRDELAAMMRRYDPEIFLRDPLTAEVAILFYPELIRKGREEKEKLGSRPFVCADFLAVRAFQNGDFELCREMLRKTAEDSPVRLYLKARLARREGDYRKSALLLRKWLELDRRGGIQEGKGWSTGRLPAETAAKKKKEKEENKSGSKELPIRFTPSGKYYGMFFPWKGIFLPDEEEEECEVPDSLMLDMHETVRGEIGALQYSEHLYQEALYSFLLGGSWSDAAWIAEVKLCLPELLEFVEAHRDNPQIPSPMRRRLCHLLARRLMRGNRFSEAAPFFPDKLRRTAEEFAGLTEISGNGTIPSGERSLAYFRLGQLMLLYDIELFGYELHPDYFICEGRYDSYPSAQKIPPETKTPDSGILSVPPSQSTFPPSSPFRLSRFHYRIREAGYFRKAGELSGNPELRFLSHLAGGLVLRNRNPEEAEPFYHRLVRMRFPRYSFELDRYRWIPSPPANWKQQIASCHPENTEEVQTLIAGLLSFFSDPPQKEAETSKSEKGSD